MDCPSNIFDKQSETRSRNSDTFMEHPPLVKCFESFTFEGSPISFFGHSLRLRIVRRVPSTMESCKFASGLLSRIVSQNLVATAGVLRTESIVVAGKLVRNVSSKRVLNSSVEPSKPQAFKFSDSFIFVFFR
jgi:hypothetical protein